MTRFAGSLLAAVSLFMLVGPALEAQNEREIRRHRRPVRDSYIVVLRSADDPEAMGRQTAALHRGRLRHVYRQALRGFAVRLPEAAARLLANDPRVAFVEEDGLVTLAALQGNATWGIDRIDQRLLPLNAEYSYTREGTGVSVHVLDTGIRISHSEFGGRAFRGGDYIDDDNDGDPADVGNDDGNPAAPDGDDCHGHGTHVAGTIGGISYGVAKDVTVWGHRVLDCSGSGATSGIIAALDAVTENATRPAVVNMSLGGSPSSAFDSAVRRAVAAGITVVVAAGNSNADASSVSPARVAEAITVGATTSADARASFSNFGPLLDLFAPGVQIVSAGIADDLATRTLSGTSMAAPHVAGAAALYLQGSPAASPAVVRDALVNAATADVVTSPGLGSPNALLFSGNIPPSITVITPNGGEQLTAGSPSVIRWTADDADGLSHFDVEVSVNSGESYAAVQECSGLGGAARECTWNSPGPVTSTARLRVTAYDRHNAAASDVSDSTFTVVGNVVNPQITSPAAGATLSGSSQVFQWSAGTGASNFYLYLGSTPGANDLLNAALGNALTVTATGLPTDGRTIHATLWWHKGSWQRLQTTYAAATSGGGGGGGGGGSSPQITSPAAGAILSGSSQVFQWSAGTGASNFWLYLGSTPGANDLLNAALGSALTVTATGLPTDGRTIHATLWWHNGGWQRSQTSYTAATSGGGGGGGGNTNPQIISPAVGSTLSSSSQVFQWSAGTGASDFWLYLGSSKGANDLLQAAMGNALTVTATGLPTDGRTIYATLWWRNGGWQQAHTTYTAATSGSGAGINRQH